MDTEHVGYEGGTPGGHVVGVCEYQSGDPEYGGVQGL